MRVERHPYLNVWVREDGCVYVPQSGKHPAHWTFGCQNSWGYRLVKLAGKNYRVHRLVAEAFIQYPIPKGMEVDHISRDKSANMASNLRIVSRSENMRNRADHDRVDARGGTHVYEDAWKARREYNVHYRAEHPEKVREYQAQYYQARCKTHRNVRFADGSKHWLPNEEAEVLLLTPLKERHYGK